MEESDSVKVHGGLATPSSRQALNVIQCQVTTELDTRSVGGLAEGNIVYCCYKNHPRLHTARLSSKRLVRTPEERPMAKGYRQTGLIGVGGKTGRS